MKRVVTAVILLALLLALPCACAKKAPEPAPSVPSSPADSSLSSSKSSSSSQSSLSSSAPSSSEISSESSSASDSASFTPLPPVERPYDGIIPDELQELFDKTLAELFGPDIAESEPDYMEGGSVWYRYSQLPSEPYLLFSPFGEPEDNYLQGIAGSVSLLIEGKNTVSVADLEAEYGDRFSVEADMMYNSWVGILNADGFIVYFENLDSVDADDITHFRMRVDDSLYE